MEYQSSQNDLSEELFSKLTKIGECELNRWDNYYQINFNLLSMIGLIILYEEGYVHFEIHDVESADPIFIMSYDAGHQEQFLADFNSFIYLK